MSDTENVLFATKPSIRRAAFYAIIYSALVLFGRIKTNFDPNFNPVWWSCFGLVIFLLFLAYLKRWTTTYIITNHEVQSFSGIFARQSAIVPHKSITNASSNQTFFERLLGIVNLNIDTAGGDVKEITFNRILKRDAIEAAKIIRQQRPTN